MGAGKTSVGLALEQLTGALRYETDEIVLAKLGMPITEIFAQFGPERFREEETAALRNLPAEEKMIVVTGGGIVLRDENLRAIKRLGRVALLYADEETLFRRISAGSQRPLLNTDNPRETVAQLLAERRSFYERAADFRIDTSTLAPIDVAREILARIDNL